MEEEKRDNKKIFLLVGVALLLFVLLFSAYLFFASRGESDGLRGTTSFFGLFGDDISREGNTINVPGDTLLGSEEEGARPRLRKLSSLPVAGAMFKRGANGEPLVRYMERERGNIYDVASDSGREVRVTNDTNLRVHDAVFGNNGNTVIFRFVDPYGVIKTRLAQFVPDPESDVLGHLSEGNFLPDDVLVLAPSVDKSRLLFMREVSGAASGELVDLVTRSVKHVFDFPFSEWGAELKDSNTLFLTTKASGMFPGYSYRYNIDTKTMTKVLDAKNGLTTLYSPSGAKVLYSEVISGKTILIGADLEATQEDVDSSSFYLDFSTLPEKCVWSKNETMIYCGAPGNLPKGVLPDAWYQGKVFFDDRLRSYSITSGIPEILVNPEFAVGELIDVVAPFLSDDESELFFINKRDGILWALALGAPSTLGEEGEELTPEELKDAQGSQL